MWQLQAQVWQLPNPSQPEFGSCQTHTPSCQATLKVDQSGLDMDDFEPPPGFERAPYQPEDDDEADDVNRELFLLSK